MCHDEILRYRAKIAADEASEENPIYDNIPNTMKVPMMEKMVVGAVWSGT